MMVELHHGILKIPPYLFEIVRRNHYNLSEHFGMVFSRENPLVYRIYSINSPGIESMVNNSLDSSIDFRVFLHRNIDS